MSEIGNSQSEVIEHAAREIVARLREHGHEAFFAGGCVRDRLLGRPSKDIDIATSAGPDEVQHLFPDSHAVGKAFGVVIVEQSGFAFEIATFREEGPYSDGRRPDSVSFTDAEHDAQRRDFTINALFFDPTSDQVLDYINGQEDLKQGIVRAVGDPATRFEEDHLRMLRAVRFAATLEFSLAPATETAIQTSARLIRRISAERIRDEILRTLTEAIKPGDALQLWHELGLLQEMLPEVEALIGVEQPPAFHPEGDVFTHTKLMLDHLGPPPRDPVLVFAVLLHDIGKPATKSWGPGSDGEDRIRFDGHDRVGAEIAEQILRRLRCSNALIDAVTTCVRNHMRFMHVQEMRKAKLRRWLKEPTFPIELELHRVDCLSSHADLSNYDFVKQRVGEWANEPKLPDPWISGADLIKCGLSEGPRIGHWKREAYARQLDGMEPDRDALLKWLKTQLAEDR